MNNKQNLEILNNEISWFDIKESIENMGCTQPEKNIIEKIINVSTITVCGIAVLFYGYYLTAYLFEVMSYLIK